MWGAVWGEVGNEMTIVMAMGMSIPGGYLGRGSLGMDKDTKVAESSNCYNRVLLYQHWHMYKHHDIYIPFFFVHI